ncbi:dcp2 [Bugula neritina]|uniref:Dcp2 n=1 Tax=Bugula neritina TaxID=10212 RepID=A0A7J7J1E8_BUGNE|nr:dcp2 [Bugula neritina]
MKKKSRYDVPTESFSKRLDTMYLTESILITIWSTQWGDQYCRLYIVPGVSLDTFFQSQSRNEIKAMQWFPVELLPKHKKDYRHKDALQGLSPNSFFMIIPFMKPLQRWIAENPYNPHAVPEKVRTQAQKDFALKSLNQYQEILSCVSPSPPHVSPKARRHARRTGPKTQRKSQSPAQIRLLQKDQVSAGYKEIEQRKISLNIGEQDTRKPGTFLGLESPLIVPCKEWKNFKLDIDAIMKSL